MDSILFCFCFERGNDDFPLDMDGEEMQIQWFIQKASLFPSAEAQAYKSSSFKSIFIQSLFKKDAPGALFNSTSQRRRFGYCHHVNHPFFVFSDALGFRLSKETSEKTASIIQYASAFRIPPKQDNVLVDNECCYSGFEPITTVAFRVHTHTLGRSLNLNLSPFLIF